MSGICSYAQQPQPESIPWMVERQASPEWYKAQVKAWEQVVTRDPKNNTAWFNLNKAARYAYQYDPNSRQKLQSLHERMAKAIPDTYTYHICAKDYADDSTFAAHMERAYQLIPDNRKLGQECGDFIAYFWRTFQLDKMEEMAKRYYEEKSMPGNLLRYNYNELQCLPQNAIYFGNGDALLLPKTLLQYGMGVHRDKIVICASFLYLPDYYKNVCKQLGIEPEKLDFKAYNSAEKWQDYLPDRIKYIIRKSGRPAYICPSSMSDGSGLESLKEHLYNEGLVLRYNETPYDNYRIIRKNLEQNIRLDYLVEPDFEKGAEWQSANNLTYNYFILLSPLITKYKEWNNPERSEWLKNLLNTALQQSKLNTNLKKRCQEYLNKYNNE